MTIDDDWIDCGCRNLEYPCIHARAQAAKWLMEHDGTNPGDFLDYHACTDGRRIEVLRPETGDWRCERCGSVLALYQSRAVHVAEGTPL